MVRRWRRQAAGGPRSEPQPGQRTVQAGVGIERKEEGVGALLGLKRHGQHDCRRSGGLRSDCEQQQEAQGRRPRRPHAAATGPAQRGSAATGALLCLLVYIERPRIQQDGYESVGRLHCWQSGQHRLRWHRQRHRLAAAAVAAKCLAVSAAPAQLPSAPAGLAVSLTAGPRRSSRSARRRLVAVLTRVVSAAQGAGTS